ncbi:Arylsulfatase [Planctomycetes bacterium CA13]|uniref:Arylsulfatase n=1 Tax=Novipirellula herctigrandis TaxID=2527986 RepID=A0A5C5Z2J6_9BACT|nr:Arylsulfatase [Planctomycetes bacterium CA13]
MKPFVHSSRRSASVFWLLTIALLPLSSRSIADERPNIVLIVLDDAGYSDLGVFGSEISTPNIDSLSNDGVQFTQFHVTPNCSSTRASLLTGMDHHRTGLGTHAVTAKNQRGKPGYEGYLNDRVKTLPEVMQSAGYRTMMAGKWHLGSKDPATWPSARGFDDSFVLLNGGASHWEDNTPLFPSKPSQYVDNGKPIEKLPPGFYSSDYYTDKIIQSIDDSEQPCFAYLSFTAPHNPLHAPAESIEKYKSTFRDGWDVLQLRRLESLKACGLVPKSVGPQPRPEWIPAWDNLSEAEQRSAVRDIAVYAGMIDRIDENVGRLIDHLKTRQKYENTLILVMSDNGPSKTTIADYLELDGAGADFLKQFNNRIDNRGLPGSNVDLGPGWAYGLAAPLRLMKGYQSQGGVLSPLVIKAPASWQIRNKIVTAPVHVMDIMPTLLETAGVKPDTSAPKSRTLSTQGWSLQGLMQGEEPVAFEKRGFGSELFGIRAYRLGKWKILMLPVPYGTGKWQLYDLTSDPGETTDLSLRFPDRVKQLSDRWNLYASENGVVEPDEPVAYAKPPG